MKRRLLSLSTPRSQSPAPAEPAEGRRRGRTWSLWRLLPMLLLVCAALVVSAGAAEITPTAPQQGDGTENNPYQISSAAELYWFAGLVNNDASIIGNNVQQNRAAHAVLTENITINENVLNVDGTLNGTPQYGWTPIGDYYNAYTGTFDGQDHTISGLYANISSNNDTYVGLFGCIGNGKVKNVTIDDSYLSGNCNNTKAVYAGGVCGKNVNGTIENCHFIGVVYGNAIENSNAYVGGVCGMNYAAVSNTSITNCSSSGTVSGSGNSGLSIAYVGGVCGKNDVALDGNASITNCYSTSVVSSNSSIRAYVGGVCGENDANSGTATITYCYSTGAVSSSGSGEFFSNAYVGGVCGKNDVALDGNASITNCYSTSAVSSNSSNRAYVGGVCGENDANSGTATITYCYSTGAVSSSGSGEFFSNAYVGGVCGKNDVALDGNASITNCYSTSVVSSNSSIRAYVGGVCGENDANSGTASISNCYSSGNVTATSTGTDGNAYAGGVCGGNYAFNSGTASISNCTSNGDVTANSGSYAYAGGVCGWNYAHSGTASISNCTSNGDVTANSGSYACAGGVCGGNYAHSGTATVSISNCTSTGNVTATSTGTYGIACAGGVCGENSANSGTASISNCTSSGDVTATSTGTDGFACAGGVCGYNETYNSGTATASISNCTSNGDVTANSGSYAYAGGVCGENSANSGTASISNCYWLKSNSGSATNGIGNGNGEATEKTADQFASGEVAWLLNQGQENGPWRQNLGDSGDAFPVLDQSHDLVIRVNANSTSYYYNIAQIPSPGGEQAYFDANDQHIDLATHTFAANETIYLKTAVKVTVEYGNGTPDDVTYFVRDASNNNFKLPSAPTRTGYTFGGWSNGSTTHQPEATVTITADTTFTAQWTANQYTVKFDANGGDGSISNQAFTYDVPQALTANTFTRTGYTFAGWNTAADGTGTAYADERQVSNLTAVSGGTVTLYAQWTANTYTVTVETSGNGTATASPASATMGTEITLTATPRSGCHFVRWDVVSGDITIQDNQFTMPAGDVTVKAVFARNAAAKTPSQQAIDKIERAKDGDVVTIALPKGKTKLDKEVFETLAGRDVTLEISLSNGVTWTVNGQDIPADAHLTDLDLGVTMNTSTIPVDIINAITGEVSTMQLTLAHDGDFGFTLTLTAPLGAKYADLWANLYYYDGNAETLTFQTAAQIGEDGTAALRFTHASQYVIVIDDRDHTPKDFPFADVTTGDWFYEAVDYVFQRDLMNGTGGARFTPNGTASRAMVATILWRMAGEPQANYAMSFADVPAGTWYTEAVRWAASEGIVTGYSDTKFGPDDPVTREQFAAMLYRYAQTLGEGFTGSWSFPLDFPDAAEVSDYAYEALCWMTKEKVLEGMEDGNLHPQSTATRAQLATMLMRFCQAIDG